MANDTSLPGLSGLRVLSFESRRAREMAKLIAKYGGLPQVAPSMREVPLEHNTEALAFARRLLDGKVDMVIFLTGVGARSLSRVMETVAPREKIVSALGSVKIVARGPKPMAALTEMGVPVSLLVPEPNTWRELLCALDNRKDSLPLDGHHVAVQEYGASNPELLEGLVERGARVMRVPVYQWALPENTGPLRSAAESVARGEADIALFTTSVQVTHLFQIAKELTLEGPVRAGFARMVVGSIGPVTSQALRENGLAVDFEPPHPKMGLLVATAAQRAAELLRLKRGVRAS